MSAIDLCPEKAEVLNTNDSLDFKLVLEPSTALEGIEDKDKNELLGSPVPKDDEVAMDVPVDDSNQITVPVTAKDPMKKPRRVPLITLSTSAKKS